MNHKSGFKRKSQSLLGSISPNFSIVVNPFAKNLIKDPNSKIQTPVYLAI